MKDPVIAPDGHTYDRDAITEWLTKHGTSPHTRNKMRIEDLVPNRVIADLLSQNAHLYFHPTLISDHRHDKNSFVPVDSAITVNEIDAIQKSVQNLVPIGQYFPPLMFSYDTGKRDIDDLGAGPGLVYTNKLIHIFRNYKIDSFSRLHMKPGDDFNTVYYSKLKGRFSKCQVFIVLLTKDLYQSKTCLEELDIAIKAPNITKIIPIRLEDDLPDVDEQWQMIDANDEKGVLSLENVQTYLNEVPHFPARGSLFTEPDGVQTLVRQVADHLQMTVHFENPTVAVDGNAPPSVTALVKLLKIGSSLDKVEAAAVLRDMPNDDDNTKNAVREMGGIPPLVGLVRNGSRLQKENASGALRYLSYCNTENQITIVSEGALPPLIELVKSGSPLQKEYATRTIGNLAYHEFNELIIATEGGIPPLIDVARDGTCEQKNAAAYTLSNLGCNLDNQVAISSAGGIPPLIELVKEGTNEQKEFAAAALCNLADNNDNAITIAKEEVIIAIIDLVKNGTSEQKKNSAALLLNLSENIEENQITITSAGAIPPLIELAKNGTADQKRISTHVLCNLVANNVNEKAVARDGGIPFLTEVSETGTDKQKEIGKTALEKFKDMGYINS